MRAKKLQTPPEKTQKLCASAFIKNKRRNTEAQRIYRICDIRVAFAQFALKISVPAEYFRGNASAN